MSELLENARSRIEALGMDFQFMGIAKLNRDGVERETWVLEYEGDQFVFVPGQKNVVLGWDTDQCSLGEGVLEGLREDFDSGHSYYQREIEETQNYYQKDIATANANGDLEKVEELRSELAEELNGIEEEMTEKGYVSWDNFLAKWNENLSQCLSPLRTVDIGDMIVEVDSRYIEEDMPSLSQAVCALKEGPFTLATEDEWEYLCNGGARTLFRWGDTLKDVLAEIYEVGRVSKDEEDTPSVLEQPNALGLFIAYDSYKYEIIDNTVYTKGGDGGCSLCGGDGAIYVLPCYTAFYRHPTCENEDYYRLSRNYYSYRRIVRLP